jgi:hypothetical protein
VLIRLALLAVSPVSLAVGPLGETFIVAERYLQALAESGDFLEHNN